MKSLLLAFCVCIAAGPLMAQTAKTEPIKFATTEHDFGKIKQNVPVHFDFEFTNVSNKPIVIESAVASCGCTTPSWPETPIAPGKTGVIKTGFNAAALGVFNKQITIKVAGVPQPIQVTIKGEVLDAGAFARQEREQKK